jgi:hypothetical protein
MAIDIFCIEYMADRIECYSATVDVYPRVRSAMSGLIDYMNVFYQVRMLTHIINDFFSDVVGQVIQLY